jgi:cytochrome oxidase Cu insertion factor (SCO1/SenC/PrrC family)
MPKRTLSALLVLAVAAVALAAIVIFAGSSRPDSPATTATPESAGPSGFDGAALGAGIAAPNFTLTDQVGRAVSLSDYRGQVTVLSFLYSSCGAPCAVIAQQIRGALDDLPHPAAVLIVSADPGADSPASVRRFLARASLTGRVQYLTGPPARVRAVLRAYHVKAPGVHASAFGRATPVILIDRGGVQRVLFEIEQLTPDSLAHDIGKLQSG